MKIEFALTAIELAAALVVVLDYLPDDKVLRLEAAIETFLRQLRSPRQTIQAFTKQASIVGVVPMAIIVAIGMLLCLFSMMATCVLTLFSLAKHVNDDFILGSTWINETDIRLHSLVPFLHRPVILLDTIQYSSWPFRLLLVAGVVLMVAAEKVKLGRTRPYVELGGLLAFISGSPVFIPVLVLLASAAAAVVAVGLWLAICLAAGYLIAAVLRLLSAPMALSFWLRERFGMRRPTALAGAILVVFAQGAKLFIPHPTSAEIDAQMSHVNKDSGTERTSHRTKSRASGL